MNHFKVPDIFYTSSASYTKKDMW